MLKSLATPVVCVVTGVLLAVWISAALAQGTPTADAEPAKPSLEVVPIEAVSEQAVQTATLLETLVPTTASDAALSQVRAEAELLRRRIDSRVRRIRLALASTPKLRSMQEWETDLRGFLTSLESLARDVDEKLNRLRKALEQIDAEAARWQATEDQAVSKEASAAVIGRINATTAAVGRARSQLSGQRDEILSLRDRLVDPTADIERTLRRLRTETQARLEGILTRDRPMVWNANLYRSILEELE